MYFRNYGLPKRWLDTFLRNLVVEDFSKGNMLTGPKHCCNLNDNTFTTLIDHCEGN